MSGFDASGLPLDADCAASHPDSGHGCIEPAGHDGLHRAMGRLRIQAFGPSAQGSDICGGFDPMYSRTQGRCPMPKGHPGGCYDDPWTDA